MEDLTDTELRQAAQTMAEHAVAFQAAAKIMDAVVIKRASIETLTAQIVTEQAKLNALTQRVSAVQADLDAKLAVAERTRRERVAALDADLQQHQADAERTKAALEQSISIAQADETVKTKAAQDASAAAQAYAKTVLAESEWQMKDAQQQTADAVAHLEKAKKDLAAIKAALPD